MEPSFTFEQRDSDSHFLHFPTRRRRRKRYIVRLASYTEIIIERFTERNSFSTRERKSKNADDETFEIKIRYSRYIRVYTSIRHRSRFLFVDFGSSTTLEWIGFRNDTRNLLRSKKLISILKKKKLQVVFKSYFLHLRSF